MPADAAGAAARTSRAEFRAVFPGVMVALFLSALDQMILASALPALGGAFGTLAHLSWVVTAYLLAATVAAPLYGRLGDRYGRRRLLAIALCVFTLGSVCCAAAPSLAWLVAARALQGFGGGGLQTLSQSLVGEHVPPRERPRYQAYFASVYAFSSTLGPVVGALLTEHAGWRAVFLVNVPLAAVALALVRRIPPSASVSDPAPFRPDPLGLLLFAATIGCGLVALTTVAHAWPPGGAVAGLFVAALAAGAALVAWERRAIAPALPLWLLAIPAVRLGVVVTLGNAAVFFASTLYLPLFLQLGRSVGIAASGLLLLPVTLSNALGAALTGRLIERSGDVTGWPPRGLAVTALAMLLLAIGTHRLPTAAVIVLMMLAGAGLGTVMPAMQVVVQSAVGRGDLGVASAAVAISRSLGAALGSAVVGVVVFASLRDADPAVAGAMQRLLQDPGAAAVVSAAAREALRAHLDRTFELAFATIGALAVACALAARRVPALRLDATRPPVSGPS